MSRYHFGATPTRDNSHSLRFRSTSFIISWPGAPPPGQSLRQRVPATAEGSPGPDRARQPVSRWLPKNYTLKRKMTTSPSAMA
jgi:hypothetical protein